MRVDPRNHDPVRHANTKGDADTVAGDDHPAAMLSGHDGEFAADGQAEISEFAFYPSTAVVSEDPTFSPSLAKNSGNARAPTDNASMGRLCPFAPVAMASRPANGSWNDMIMQLILNVCTQYLYG
nr:hypothetical protein [Defluviicoccus vanus]